MVDTEQFLKVESKHGWHWRILSMIVTWIGRNRECSSNFGRQIRICWLFSWSWTAFLLVPENHWLVT